MWCFRVIVVAVCTTCILLFLIGIACRVDMEDACLPIPSFLHAAHETHGVEFKHTQLGVADALISVSCTALLPVVLLAIFPKRERYLYVSHFLAVWTDRMWEMSIPLILMDIFRDTLLPTALYTGLVYAGILIFQPVVGDFVDRSARFRVIQVSNIIENVCIMSFSALICFIMMISPEMGIEKPTIDSVLILSFVVLVILGWAGALFNNASTIAIERDWVLVIADTTGAEVTNVNILLRRIDLLCKALAPAAFALMYSRFGDSPRIRVFFGSATLLLWNVVSFPLELSFNWLVFVTFTSLSNKVHTHAEGTRHAHPNGERPHFHVARKLQNGSVLVDESVVECNTHCCENPEEHAHIIYKTGDDVFSVDSSKVYVRSDVANEEEQFRIAKTTALLENRKLIRKVEVCSNQSASVDFLLIGYDIHNSRNRKRTSFSEGWELYRKQKIFGASLAYTMLWMTVLSNGELMTSYLQWGGVPTVYLGIGRGVGAFFGMLGTVTFPFLYRKTNSVSLTGLISIWYFLAMLFPIPWTSDIMMISWVAISRLGLWSFDLAITQITQENVLEEHRGIVASYQTSSYNFFFLCIEVLGMVFSDPRDFKVLQIISICVAATASAIYTFWWKRCAGAKYYGGREAFEMIKLDEEPIASDPVSQISSVSGT